MWELMGQGHRSSKVAVAAVFVALALAVSVPDARAQSLNVAMIGGNNVANGGYLPITGPAGELGDFAFTTMAPADVSSTNLAAFDTAVLNMASSAIGCNMGTFTNQQKADLVAFVTAGKKLIIYDSECTPIDYSWLPYPFVTVNPGAMGSIGGVLTDVEENPLSSSDPASPHYVDLATLAATTDAVGDMNVMTTFDPHWCLDLSGTNVLGVTGPVQTYAKYPEGTDTGLIIYNGLDLDDMNYTPWLRKLWVLQLQQPFNPSGLPCGVPVIGINLTPETAVNPVGSNHTVTATLTDLQGVPQPSIGVTFTVVSGPNAGATGVCSANADCTTDETGQVSFTYAGTGGIGIDTIEACFTNDLGQALCTQASKEWVGPRNAVRPTTTEKGSILVFPKVELRWNAAGDFIQDTFISITNDYNAEVPVLLYFVSETCTNVDNDIVLTQNQPAWWSAYSGLPGPNGGVSPFTVLGAPYPDPEGSTDLVLRGYIVAWAINLDHTAIRWNHLLGEATLVNYANGDAWEYTAYAFPALVGENGQLIGAPGVLNLNGGEYASGFDLLVLDFFAVGSQAFSGGGRAVVHDTDLALLILDQDFRQETPGPYKTKVKFDIWNENEISFSGMEYCITKWDQSLLSNHGGHFLLQNLQTNKGKARIDGMQSILCPYSTPHSLLGVAAKLLRFDGVEQATAGTSLVGTGTQAATILYDIPNGGGEKINPVEVAPVVIQKKVR